MRCYFFKIFFVLLLIFSCDTAKKNAGNTKVVKVLNKDSLVFKVEKSLKNKNYINFKYYYEILKDSFPNSSALKTHETLYKKILVALNAKKAKKEAKIKAENIKRDLRNTGQWLISAYVDEFGRSTNDRFITQDLISGVFSNSATTNSNLNVKIVIHDFRNIYIKLYEYGSKNPVKKYSSKYSIHVLGSDGKKINVKANNYSDRLTLGRKSSERLHELMLREGLVKFVIYEDSSFSTYKFDLQTDRYKNTHMLFREIKKSFSH